MGLDEKTQRKRCREAKKRIDDNMRKEKVK